MRTKWQVSMWVPPMVMPNDCQDENWLHNWDSSYFKNKNHPTLVIVPLLNNLKISYGKNYKNGKVMDKRHR
jgi:hypothetical protein